jgi:LuxR family maltose regulon positive regulatory protein
MIDAGRATGPRSIGRWNVTGGERVVEARQRTVAFAKTTRPAVGSIVPRQRLFTRLDGAAGRTVAWISGPPGAGKTTLAASYAEARGFRCLWYQVDPDDSDVATFFHYLGHAARRLEGGQGRELPAFTPQYRSDVASFARMYFRQLFARAKPPFALVLDSLHEVPPDSALHAVLEVAFAQIPKHCTVIVTSRSDPPAALARMRVAGEMVCVGWEELRIAPEELGAIAQLRGQKLSVEAATQLHERTQGWAAGLVLMLEHTKLSGRVAELPEDAAPQVIFDYLAGEIYDRFDPDTKRFLARVACLPRMTAEVAQALAEEPKAERLLLNLARNDYFVSEVLSEDGRIYQLHPLLREFLRSRAALEQPEALGTEQLQRAAALLREAGQTEDAVSLLVECRDWAQVARIAADEAQLMLDQGRSETLGGWLELLPPALLHADAELLYASGACRLHSSPRAARRFFEQAYDSFRTTADRRGMVRSCCGLLNATILEFDDLAQLDHWTGVLSGLLREGGSGERDAAARAVLIRALLLRDPGNAELGAWLEGAELAVARAMVALLQGDLVAADAAADALLTGAGTLPALDSTANALAAALHYLLIGAHPRAREVASNALAAAEREGVHVYDDWLRLISMAALLGAGERDAARGELRLLEGGGVRLRRGDRALVHYLRGWLAALEGDLASASMDARSALQLAVEAGLPWLECLARAALADMLARAGDQRGCEAQLRSALALSDRMHSVLLRFVVQLAAAQSAAAMSDERAALGPLASAFALGREHGFRHAPWWRSQAVADLCALALRHGIEPEYARALVRSRRLLPQVAPLRLREWPWPFHVHLLGGFQLLRQTVPVEFSGKAPGRPMELMKVLVALGGQNVRADQLADALWPHVDADYAHKSLTATLHRLRRLLGDDDALVLRDARLSLNPALIWVDAWALESVLAALDEALRAPVAEAGLSSLQALADEAFALYRGPFLPDESEQPSYIACREQIRSRLLRCIGRVARRYEEDGQREAAADCFLRIIEADALFEAPYRGLMQCYQRCADPSEARATYERLRTVLSTRLKIMPSPETQAVYASLGTPAQS